MNYRIFCFFVIAFFTACGSDIPKDKNAVIVDDDMGSGSDTAVSPDASIEEPLPDPTVSSPDAPKILDLTSNVTRLTEGESVIISAIVSDPQGNDTLLGGTLRDPETGSTYGSFEGTGGTFSLTVSWAQLNQVRASSFSNEASRAVVARFLDTDANESTQALALTLHCAGSPACEGACGKQECDGTCRAPSAFDEDPANCGACGVTCGGDEYCNSGICMCNGETCGTECVDTDSNPAHCGECNNACSVGTVCDSGSCEVPNNVGGPCTDASDCPTGDCVPEQFGPPGGYCTVSCSSSDPCPNGFGCLTNPERPDFSTCAKFCASSSECRDGLDCREAPGTTQEFCLPF